MILQVKSKENEKKNSAKSSSPDKALSSIGVNKQHSFYVGW